MFLKASGAHMATAVNWTDTGIHPWRRYAARLTDMLTIGLAISFVGGVVGYMAAPDATEAWLAAADTPVGRFRDTIILLALMAPISAYWRDGSISRKMDLRGPGFEGRSPDRFRRRLSTGAFHSAERLGTWDSAAFAGHPVRFVQQADEDRRDALGRKDRDHRHAPPRVASCTCGHVGDDDPTLGRLHSVGDRLTD